MQRHIYVVHNRKTEENKAHYMKHVLCEGVGRGKYFKQREENMQKHYCGKRELNSFRN